MLTADEIRKLYTNRGLLYQRVFVDFLGWGAEVEKFFRRSNLIRPNCRILDAGCGTGVISRKLYQLARERGCAGMEFHAFDLTQRMLEIFQQWMTREEISGIELRQADVLETGTLPSHWREYDLVVSSALLEYLPRHQLGNALANLKRLLKQGGTLLAFITKRNIVTRMLAEKLWRTATFEEGDVRILFHDAGFHQVNFGNLSPGWSNSIMVIEAQATRQTPTSTREQRAN